MRRFRNVLLALCAGAMAACEFDEVTVPSRAARPVLHFVLDPYGGRDIYVLLERTLGGRVPTSESAFDPEDPIVTGGGEPIVGARIEIRNVTTGVDVGIARDMTEGRDDGKGRGLYYFENVGCTQFYCPTHGILLTRGHTYSIHVTVPGPETFTGTTTIPDALSRPDTGLRRVFNAQTDTYVFSWPVATGLRRYALQIQTPYGPFQTFAAAESLAIDGTLRNFQQDRFPRVFVPGFLQGVQALAVDRNYFDYYRSENDPFTGQGLLSHLDGAIGVFGAVLPIRYQDIDVVAPFDEPVDGVWELEDSPDPSFPVRLTTWADGTFASGKLEDVYDADLRPRRGILGTRDGSRLQLAVLEYQAPRDTAWTLDGTVQGDVLVTTSPQKGTQTWRRASAP